MRFLNRRENPNALVGLFLLILLAIFAGPTVLPDLISQAVPFVDEGVPCERLRDGSLRGQQQSLIGRDASLNADAPIGLRVSASSVGVDNTLTVEIIVINETIGTVPIVLTSDSMIVNTATAQNGLGVYFGPQPNAPIAGAGEGAVTYPAERIRLLAPRQRCVHRVRINVANIPQPGASIFAAGEGSEGIVTAFYRNDNRGQAQPGYRYPDQGLWTGVVVSDSEVFRPSG